MRMPHSAAAAATFLAGQSPLEAALLIRRAGGGGGSGPVGNDAVTGTSRLGTVEHEVTLVVGGAAVAARLLEVPAQLEVIAFLQPQIQLNPDRCVACIADAADLVAQSCCHSALLQTNTSCYKGCAGLGKQPTPLEPVFRCAAQLLHWRTGHGRLVCHRGVGPCGGGACRRPCS